MMDTPAPPPLHFTPAQQRHLQTALLLFEKALRQAQRLLADDGETGICYHRRAYNDPTLSAQIERTLDELEDFVRLLGFAPLEEDTRQIIAAEMNAAWAALEDCRSDRMRGYGKLDADTAALSDAALQRLSRAALALGAPSEPQPPQPPNAQARRLTLRVTPQTYDDLAELIGARGWQWEDGLRIILAAGLGYLRSNRLPEEPPNAMPQDAAALTTRLVHAESQLAAMRYRLFEIQQANADWETSSGAVYRENIGLKNLAQRHKEEIRHLQAETARLREELAQQRAAPQDAQPARSPRGTLWQRLRKFLHLA
ncbi:MAG: hypothetical protein HPY45_13910 [Anaerolineae bacterium]|nr:hypothetical protein [Anaerolineae bacterium]